jgi:hypothetical protein
MAYMLAVGCTRYFRWLWEAIGNCNNFQGQAWRPSDIKKVVGPFLISRCECTYTRIQHKANACSHTRHQDLWRRCVLGHSPTCLTDAIMIETCYLGVVTYGAH